MKDLFLKDELQKVAYTTKVGPRATTWGKDVLERFYNEHPELTNASVQIKFKEKDEAKGYAVGAINVAGQLAVPVIIKDLQLSPLDVAISEKGVLPFTTETIRMLLANKSAFAGLARVGEPDTFTRFFDNTSMFGQSFAIEKTGTWDILSQIADMGVDTVGIDEKIAEALTSDLTLLNSIEKDPELMAGLQKIAKMDALEADLVFEPNIQYIYKEEDNTYTKLSANTSIDEITEQKGLEKHEIEGQDHILAGEVTKIAAFDPKIMLTEGYVYKLASDDVFIDGEGNYRVLVGKDEVTVKTAGYKEGGLDLLVKLAKIPEVGDVGVIYSPEKAEIATNILEVTKVAFNEDGLHRLSGEAVANSTNLIKFATLRGIDHSTYSEEKDTLYFPEHWSFAKLGKELSDSDIGQVWNPKIAELEAVRCMGLDHYQFMGPVLSKYAERRGLYEATAHKAAFGVLHCGGSIEDTQKIAELQPGHTHPIMSELTLPYTVDTIMEQVDELMNKTAGIDDYIYDTAEVLKLAAGIGSGEGVDAVLGTAFLRKDTMKRFVEMLPMFENASSTLAQMVIYSRMGAGGINEEAAREAMKHLSKVIFQLNGVKNLEKVV